MESAHLRLISGTAAKGPGLLAGLRRCQSDRFAITFRSLPAQLEVGRYMLQSIFRALRRGAVSVADARSSPAAWMTIAVPAPHDSFRL
jgi:hypothetical protein